MGITSFLKNRKVEKEQEKLELSRLETEFPSIFPKRKPLLLYSKVYKKICQFKGCNEKLTFMNRYECPYCCKQHCDKHRLPEEHSCKNPKLPEYIRKNMGQKIDREGNNINNKSISKQDYYARQHI